MCKFCVYLISEYVKSLVCDDFYVRKEEIYFKRLEFNLIFQLQDEVYMHFWSTVAWNLLLLQCSAECGNGVRIRRVACVDGSELFCNPKEKPKTEMHCFGPETSCDRAKWFASPWTSVSTSTIQKIKHSPRGAIFYKQWWHIISYINFLYIFSVLFRAALVCNIETSLA